MIRRACELQTCDRDEHTLGVDPLGAMPTPAFRQRRKSYRLATIARQVTLGVRPEFPNSLVCLKVHLPLLQAHEAVTYDKSNSIKTARLEQLSDVREREPFSLIALSDCFARTPVGD